MIIAVGNSRKDKVWKNIEITWEEFLKRVKNTRRTAETIAEFRNLPKNKQDELKDVGGFVGGKLKEGRRKNGYVEYRSMLTLDMDYADKDFWETFTILFDFTCCIYSTRKHTAEKPRLRLIIPLLRTVTAEEYAAVSRKVAEEIGIEQFDDTTFEAARLMYWPSTSSDGEFVFREQKGTLLNPDEYLKRYSDWRDGSQWPVSSRMKESVKQNIKKQADPLEKEGIIGAFCRAYSISDAIDTFLSDIYKPSAIEGRYDYIPADSTAGVVLYDDKFAYSHHATDPVCGKLCNAWDLVRLHKYGDLDTDADVNTPVSKLPSFLAMREMALSDENVKWQILSERKEQVEKDFKSDNNWQSKLLLDRAGNVKNTLQNLILILENDENLKNIVFNEFADGMEIKGKAPWRRPPNFSFWREADDAQLEAYIDKNYGSFSKRNFDTAAAKVVDDRSYHPVREYFDSLPPWDGKCRLDTLLIDFFGSADNPYVRAVTRKTFVGAVARIKKPGCKFDTMLVLNGFQGQKKSSLIRRLCGEWYNDDVSLSDTKDKTAAEKLQGSWIIEISELSGMRKADVETLKAFISRQNDIYRASYGKRASPHPRQCIFIGTTNAETGFLRDTTGNRRYWPVKTLKTYEGDPADLSDEFVNQFWAEALYYYEKGEKLYIEDDKILQYAIREQHEAMESDDREGIVREYLDTLLPENWKDMDLYMRRNFLNGNEFGSPQKGTVKRERVCTMEIWCECFGRERGQLKKSDANEIAAIMARIEGWKKSDQKARFGMYGIVRGYERIKENER